MIKIINDIHGNRELLKEILNERIAPGDIVVANGDIAGSRGPITAEVVRLFYEVGRGETAKAELDDFVSEVLDKKVALSDDIVYRAIHSGTFQKYLADKYPTFRQLIVDETKANLGIIEEICAYASPKGGEVEIVPGNGEMSALDFDVSKGVDKEVTVSPLERVYNQLALRGLFGEMGAFYANYPRLINEDTLVLPVDYVEIWMSGNARSVFNVGRVRRVITHYPPYDETMLRVMKNVMNYKENTLGIDRMKAVKEILDTCPNLELVVFGHIHRATTAEEVAKLPLSMEFETGKYRLIWNRPGHVYKLDF